MATSFRAGGVQRSIATLGAIGASWFLLPSAGVYAYPPYEPAEPIEQQEQESDARRSVEPSPRSVEPRRSVADEQEIVASPQPPAEPEQLPLRPVALSISDPVYALPGTTVTVVVAGLEQGAEVRFTLDGSSYLVNAGADGRALLAPQVPDEPGTYPVVAELGDGEALTTEIIVVEELPSQPDELAGTGGAMVFPGLALAVAVTVGGAALVAVSRRRLNAF